MAARFDDDAEDSVLGTLLLLEGRGGGRIISDGVIVCGRLLPGMSWIAELRFGSGSVSSCIGESKVEVETYFGVGGSAEVVASDMHWSNSGKVWLLCRWDATLSLALFDWNDCLPL